MHSAHTPALPPNKILAKYLLPAKESTEQQSDLEINCKEVSFI